MLNYLKIYTTFLGDSLHEEKKNLNCHLLKFLPSMKTTFCKYAHMNNIMTSEYVSNVLNMLTLDTPSKLVAEDILFCIAGKIMHDISCELFAWNKAWYFMWKTIHMKYQALFSLKSTKKTNKHISNVVCCTYDWHFIGYMYGRPRWLSWMRRPTGDQEVAGSTPAEVGNILSWRLIMKYFLRSFSPFRWSKKGSCQFLAKECTQYWLTA